MPSDAVVLAWIGLVRAYGQSMRTVQTKLKDEQLPPLEWYDVLLELERAGPLRQRDLQKRLLLAQYNLSRLLDRMAHAELLERTACEEDGRGQVVAINDKGRALRRRMWPLYAEALQAALGSKLTEDEVPILLDLLGRLAAPSELVQS